MKRATQGCMMIVDRLPNTQKLPTRSVKDDMSNHGHDSSYFELGSLSGKLWTFGLRHNEVMNITLPQVLNDRNKYPKIRKLVHSICTSVSPISQSIWHWAQNISALSHSHTQSAFLSNAKNHGMLLIGLVHRLVAILGTHSLPRPPPTAAPSRSPRHRRASPPHGPPYRVV